MAGPTGTARLRAFVSRNSGRDRRARRLLGIGQASVLLAGLLLPTLIAGPVAANTRPATATLTVTKACAPTNDPGRFNLRIDSSTVLANAACGSSKTVTVTAGRHNISETSGSGTNLSNYTATFGATCPGGWISLTANQSATCTITNTRKPPPATATLTVAKACLPTTDPGRFNLLVDGKTALANAACGSSTQVTVTTGRHTVSETSGSGTNLFNYAAAIGGGCDPTGTITLAANQSATCTITNTRKPTLTVVKACVPDPTTGQFDLLIDGIDRGDASCAAGGNRTTRPVMLGVGPHTIGETADGTTDLSAYIATFSANCAGATVTLAAGQNAVCTITNTVRTPTLAVAKTDNGPWTVGQTGAQYSITVSNAGTTTTSGTITVTDTLPTGLSLSATPSGTGWTCPGAAVGGTSISCTSTTAIAGGTSGNAIIVPVSLGPTVPTGTNAITNTAAAYGGGDPSHATAATAATGYDTTTINAPLADLSITKTDNQGGSSITPSTGAAVAGTSITYTIVASNAGPAAVTGASVTDTLPAAVTSVSWTAVASAGASDTTASGTGNIADTVSLASGATVTYTVTGTIDPAASGTLSNTATVTAPVGVSDPNTANNSATDSDTLTPLADLSITKTDNQGGSSITPSTGSYVPGGSITYTITVSNAGPSTATSVGVSDNAPTGITSFVWSGNGQTDVSGTISDTIASLAPGASVTYTVTAGISPTATGTLSNTATVTGASDPNTANNSATDSDTIDPGPIAVADGYFISKIDPIKGDISCRSGCVLTDTVATNDTPSPVGGNVWSIAPGGEPTVGTVVMNPDGSFTYSTNIDGLEVDGFTYQIEDAYGLVSTATVGIEIVGAK